MVSGLSQMPTAAHIPKCQPAVGPGGGAELLPQPVPGQRPDPRAEVRPGLVLVEVEVGVHEHLLGDVLGRVTVPEQGGGDPPHRLLVQPDEPGERLGVPGQDRGNDPVGVGACGGS